MNHNLLHDNKHEARTLESALGHLAVVLDSALVELLEQNNAICLALSGIAYNRLISDGELSAVHGGGHRHECLCVNRALILRAQSMINAKKTD